MQKTDMAVVCVSGGMDSLVALALASNKHEKLTLLHVDYGQLTEEREQRSFKELADWYKVPKERVISVKTDVLQRVGTSCLTDSNIEVPVDGVEPDTIPISYVPFRNGNILSMAASVASALKAETIYTGFVEEDSSGYPDCRESFSLAFEEAIDLGTRPETHIQLKAPCLHLTKPEIVETAIRLSAPLHLTWSCYMESKVACGVCDSCRLRLNGFLRAGYIDPVPYQINIDWRKALKYEPREIS